MVFGRTGTGFVFGANPSRASKRDGEASVKSVEMSRRGKRDRRENYPFPNCLKKT